MTTNQINNAKCARHRISLMRRNRNIAVSNVTERLKHGSSTVVNRTSIKRVGRRVLIVEVGNNTNLYVVGSATTSGRLVNGITRGKEVYADGSIYLGEQKPTKNGEPLYFKGTTTPVKSVAYVEYTWKQTTSRDSPSIQNFVLNYQMEEHYAFHAIRKRTHGEQKA